MHNCHSLLFFIINIFSLNPAYESVDHIEVYQVIVSKDLNDNERVPCIHLVFCCILTK